MKKIRSIWANITQYGPHIDKQVEIDAHYSGYLSRQANDIAAYKKDESIKIPSNLDYGLLSLSNEVKSKLIKIRPKTLGQALRIDGITPAAAIILLSHLKKKSKRRSA